MKPSRRIPVQIGSRRMTLSIKAVKRLAEMMIMSEETMQDEFDHFPAEDAEVVRERFEILYNELVTVRQAFVRAARRG